MRASARGGLQDDGDEVRLRLVVFAEALGCARRVEVSERDVAQRVRGGVPLERALEGELRLAVRVRRVRRV